jgi:hypothetical protein
MAVPDAASTAKAIRDFFIASFSKVEHRAPAWGLYTVRSAKVPRQLPL